MLSDCPDTWMIFNGRCYGHPQDKRLNWEAAELYCKEWLPGAHLASVHSQEEQQFIVDNFPEDIWLGGQGHKDSNWEWSDGTPFDYTAWYPGEPNSHGGDKVCIMMDYDGKKNGMMLPVDY